VVRDVIRCGRELLRIGKGKGIDDDDDDVEDGQVGIVVQLVVDITMTPSDAARATCGILS
jgi:hypothetical protein